jgi:hypothetical protein
MLEPFLFSEKSLLKVVCHPECNEGSSADAIRLVTGRRRCFTAFNMTICFLNKNSP